MINNLLPAMRNLNNALVRAGVRDVKVSFLSSSFFLLFPDFSILRN
ncbi:unnamed protein product [Arabidopsis halleri]